MKKGKLISSTITRLTLAAMVAGAFSSIVTATEVHKWVDENGVVHFSDTNPMSVETQTIDMPDAGRSVASSVSPTLPQAPAQASDSEAPVNAAQARRDEIARKRQERKEAQAENEYLCSRHRQRLEQIEPARRVYYTDENGQQVRMNDDKRVELVEESKSFLAENCQ